MSEPPLAINWSDIDTLLLDMDGTLLDLHFDSYFWKQYLPLKYAQHRGLDVITSKRLLAPHFKATERTLNWYCIDYWSKTLNLDIGLLKHDLTHLIAFKPLAREFLIAMREKGKRLILVTNAHEKSLSLKLEHTLLDNYLDSIVSAHELGLPKESPLFWGRLLERVSFDRNRTLLIDDNIHALASAEGFGIQHLLAVTHPSSQEGPVYTDKYMAMTTFAQLL